MGEPASGHLHPARDLSRRRLLQGMVAVAGLAAGLAGCRGDQRSPGPVPLGRRAPNAAGLNSFVLGMHLHASTSEGVGSVRSQLAQAAATGFDVAWFTEHDWRRRRLLFRPTFSFLPHQALLGGTWSLPALPVVGSVTGDSGGSVVTDRTSPNDPSPTKGSLRLRSTSTGTDPAVVAHRIDSESASRMNYRSRIAGRTLTLDVLPASAGPDAWGEVRFGLSHHPGFGKRPTGECSIVYRLRTDVSARAVSSDGATAIVDVPVTGGRWQSVPFDLTADVGSAWPDMDPRDNSLHDIRLSAVSRRRAPAELYFGYLRFDETAGYDAVGVERELVARYATDVPDVLGLIGTEISLGPHLNQFGGPQHPYDYGDVRSLADIPALIHRSVVDAVHAQGGLASVNHPALASTATATSAQRTAQELLAIGAGGADLLEVGYSHHGLASMPGHLAVWDALSRNGIFLTGNGVSDDHSGQDWATQPNRFYTAAWATAREEKPLLGALAAGRAYAGYLGSFGGTIDMAVDSAVPMGAVSVRPATSRSLRIDVTGLPEGGAVEVVHGPVDYAGKPDPGTTVVSTLGSRDLASRPERAIRTGGDCFVRLQVLDASGAVVAFGQPTWLLEKPPADGVPKARRSTA